MGITVSGAKRLYSAEYSTYTQIPRDTCCSLLVGLMEKLDDLERPLQERTDTVLR